MLLKTISITGPESTGKSSLARELAVRYDTLYVEEFARKYLTELGRSYVREDILKIAQGQYALEEEKKKHARNYLFCDTDMIVCKIWSRFKYGKVDPWIEEMVESHRYDLYLLCDIDLPWEDDPLREHPQRRNALFDLYLYELKRLKAPFGVVSGSGRERIENAISIIGKTFNENIL